MPVSLPFWQPGVPAVQEPPGFTTGAFVTLLETPDDGAGVTLGLDEVFELEFEFELELELDFLAFVLSPDE